MYQIHNEQGNIQNTDTMQVFPPIKENREGRKYLAWFAIEGNEPEPMEIIDPWIAKRIERNLILQSSDWAVKTDVPLTAGKKNEWKTYRQALRDLPETYPDANNIIWPEQPAPPG